MRESLFRGKRVDNGDWTYGYLFVCWDRCYILWGMRGDNPIKEEVVPETVGEYTGLTDKNGKKIFEGDVVKEWSCWWRTPERIEVEIYEVVCKHLGRLCLKREMPYGTRSTTLNRSSTVEVIGNKHDNPELLEVEE